MLHIVRAEYIADYRVHVWFDDGTDGEVDLADVLTGPIFAPLNDPEFFRNFTLSGHTLSWPNGADFAPEYLHELIHSPVSGQR